MREATPKYDNEAAMCAAFIVWAKAQGWTAYPETCGWDVLLVRDADGAQCGVQAKMALNAKVIDQALEDRWQQDGAGPDFRAVLAPPGGGPFEKLCSYIGLTVVRAGPPGTVDTEGRVETRYGRRAAFSPDLPTIEDRYEYVLWDWRECCPTKRHSLPDYVPDVAAGASAPLQLTDWKIRALKIAVLLETRGFVERSDFRHLKLDVRRWIAEWLVPGPRGFVASAQMPNFKAQHPRVFEEIKADLATWAPTHLDAHQGEML